MILNGKIVAEKILTNISKQITKMQTKPSLAVILVGKDPSSQLYINIKEKTCKKVGIKFNKFTLSEKVTQADVINLIKKLNKSKTTNGIIIQLPLPGKFDTNAIINSISPQKDVDGLHVENLGKLLTGQETIIPPTPAGILELLKYYKISLKGKYIVLVGYGKLVGKPLAAMLATAQLDATVTICNNETKNLANFTKQADILITATGVPNLITKNMVKKGAVVIDAGTTVIKISGDSRQTIDNNKLKTIVGDVDFKNVKKIAGAITPPVGGIGPLTVAKLLENVLKVNKS